MYFRNHTEQEESKNLKIITSCCIGEAVPLELLSNDVFSSLILGDGFGVYPSENRIVAPVSGTVKDISENEHEVTIKTDDGIILIVSIGYNSADESFEAHCLLDIGAGLMQGTLIWELDSEILNSESKLTAAVIVTNISELPTFNIRYGKVSRLDTPIMTISMS